VFLELHDNSLISISFIRNITIFNRRIVFHAQGEHYEKNFDTAEEAKNYFNWLKEMFVKVAPINNRYLAPLEAIKTLSFDEYKEKIDTVKNKAKTKKDTFFLKNTSDDISAPINTVNKNGESYKRQKILKTLLINTPLNIEAERLEVILNVKTIGDLIKMTPDNILSVRGFGLIKLGKINQYLHELGLSLNKGSKR